MRQYLAGKIRNVAIAGHGSSGKTSLAEALLFKAGATDRLGKVPDGNTVCRLRPRGGQTQGFRFERGRSVQLGQRQDQPDRHPGTFRFRCGHV